jgi:hypothetical protein
MAIWRTWQRVRRRSRRIWTRCPASITISVVICAEIRQMLRIDKVAGGGTNPGTSPFDVSAGGGKDGAAAPG